ncbi:MAG: hypothetical protein HY314_14625 [Acidobacteria bacterium]|nr:hypothetical protein [Acidobacteriota bacterium]
MVPEDYRHALLEQIRALQEERLGVLAALEALKSDALQNLLRGVNPGEDVLKKVEAELKHLNIGVDLKGVDDLAQH